MDLLLIRYGNWEKISEHRKLSKNLIREFKDEVIWENISEYQTLSEDFIRKFQNEINWKKISEYQELSEESISNLKLLVESFVKKSNKLKFLTRIFLIRVF